MTNNDILRRVRYALRLNDKKMTEVFKLGGLIISEEELLSFMSKPEEEGFKKCKNKTLDIFLSGLIVYKRGPQPEGVKQVEISNNMKNINNHILRKLKIALSFRSEDMLEAFKLGGTVMSESELSALFRREDHKNYREAGDKYIRTFLKGLILMFRGE